MTVDAEGAFVFHSPVDRQVAPEPPREVVADSLDWLREWAVQRNLDLGTEVNTPLWDGKAPSYKIAVECLLEAG